MIFKQKLHLSVFLLFLLFVSPGVLSAQERDSRNPSDVPGTKHHFKLKSYPDLQSWLRQRNLIRQQIFAAAGLSVMPAKTPLNAKVFDHRDYGDFTVDKVWLETRPGFFLAGNLYAPKSGGKHPAVLLPHGHWKQGRLHDAEDYSHVALGAGFARQGYVAFAYDMVGYGDTKQTPHEFGEDEISSLWQFGPMGLQLWNSIRVIDFLSELPDVDATRIGATGASGGATQTFLLSAVDDRIAAAAPVNMVSASFQGGSPCENAPGLRVGTNNVEIAAATAPRPLFVVAATGDWTKNAPKEECPSVKAIYQLFGRGNSFLCRQFNAKHNYNKETREAVYAFFNKSFLNKSGSVTELPHNVQPEDLRLLPNSPPPAPATDFAGVFASWRRETEQLVDQSSDQDLRAALSQMTGASWPLRVTTDRISTKAFYSEATDTLVAKVDSPSSAKPFPEQPGERVFLTREGEGDRVPAIWIRGKSGRSVLIVHPEGSKAALKTLQFQEHHSRGDSILLVDTFDTGMAGASEHRGKHWSTFLRSDDANRLQDILTGLAWLRQQQPAPMDLVGIGKAAVWCTFAAALSPYSVQLTEPVTNFTGTEKEFVEQFFVPGIMRAGGWKAALRLSRMAGTSETTN
jgi:dienelactone hydrolase